MGKLFTAILNTRLSNFLEHNNKLGQEQTGFRTGFSTLDHIFTLHCIINFFLQRKNRLYCAFIDYEKAFDKVRRALLWEKLVNFEVNGNFLKTVKNMYNKAKSCIKVNGECSGYFSSVCGVRQGENLSPLFFALFLNDLKPFLSETGGVLNSLSREANIIGMNDADVNVMFQLFVLLYADDTVICAESERNLQDCLDKMHDYCVKWKLNINVKKTKVIIFSRGKIRKKPTFMYNNNTIDVVFDVIYLGRQIN